MFLCVFVVFLHILIVSSDFAEIQYPALVTIISYTEVACACTLLFVLCGACGVLVPGGVGPRNITLDNWVSFLYGVAQVRMESHMRKPCSNPRKPEEFQEKPMTEKSVKNIGETCIFWG